MKVKYFENIVKYLPVLTVCLLIGILGRIHFINKGADEFTVNVIFIIFTGFGISIYAILGLFFNELMELIIKIFPKKKTSLMPEKHTSSFGNLEILKVEQKSLIDKKNQSKIEIAINYTQKEFALYTSEEDLKLLCNYVVLYSEKSDLENVNPIKVEKLSNLDLYHFAWNIWNYFKPIKQEEVSKLLKMSFFTLKDIELDTIKSHLKDDPKKGIIKIVEDISDF